MDGAPKSSSTDAARHSGQLRGDAVDSRVRKIGIEVCAAARQGAQVLPLASAAAGVGRSPGIARPAGAGEVDRVGAGVHVHDCEVRGMVSGYLRSSG